MATVIDTLVVELGLDPKKFSQGAKKSGEDLDKFKKDTEKAAKDIEAAGKRAAAFFGEVRNQALALAAVLLGGLGLKEFVQNTVSADASTGRLSANLGMSARSLDAWRAAAEYAGDTSAGLDAAFQSLNGALQNYKLTGQMDGPLAYFYQLGVAMQDASGKMRPAQDILLDISSKMKGMSGSDRVQATQMANMLGLGGINNLLQTGKDSIQTTVAHFYEVRKSADAAAAASIKLTQGWIDMKQKASDLGDALLLRLAPALEKLLNLLDGLVAWGQEHPNLFAGAIMSLTAMGTAITLMTGIQALAGLAKLTGGFGALGLAAQAAMVGVAGVAGYAAGSLLYSKGIAGTSFGDLLGAVLHGGGSEAADPAVAAQMYKGRSGGNTGGTSGGSNLPRGLRNNNPGNIKVGSFASSHGATGSDGTFAIFPTMEAGKAAANALIASYMDRGFNTVSSIINRYAPSSENNSGAYASDVAGQLGVGVNDKLGPDQIASLTQAMYSHENGRGAMAAAGSHSSSETHIQSITINTASTDAAGIAGDMHEAISNRNLAAQANTGLI